MIPPKNHPKWASLIRGQTGLQFKVFAGNMMLSQCQRKLAYSDTPETLRSCIDEAHAFFSKYEKLYQDDLRTVF